MSFHIGNSFRNDWTLPRRRSIWVTTSSFYSRLISSHPLFSRILGFFFRLISNAAACLADWGTYRMFGGPLEAMCKCTCHVGGGETPYLTGNGICAVLYRQRVDFHCSASTRRNQELGAKWGHQARLARVPFLTLFVFAAAVSWRQMLMKRVWRSLACRATQALGSSEIWAAAFSP